MSDDMNERIRRALHREPSPEPEAPEPEPPKAIDLGSGPRAVVPRNDTHAQFGRWFSQQVHRSRHESITVNAPRGKK